MIIVRKHTEGDSRVATGAPTIDAFSIANRDHVEDVIKLGDFLKNEFSKKLHKHDWTKLAEPYKSMFYRDLCNTIEGKMEFLDGEWCKLHYNTLERHHLTRNHPDDVNLLDVLEMICDCVAAGMARSGEVREVEIPIEVLTLAVSNTVKLLSDNVVVDEGV